MKSQITVKSQLNPDVWESLLADYWDNQLCSLIRFGFPLNFQRDNPLKSHFDNHTSAKMYPRCGSLFIRRNMIWSDFRSIQRTSIERSTCFSIHNQGKAKCPHRRVIIDLSFPQGLSVNAGICRDRYLDTPFFLKLPTIDTITNQIKVLGKGCMLYKIEISRAFRHVKLDPREYYLLGLCHIDWYIDTCLPFGYHYGRSLYQRLINYIDDILRIDLPSQIDASSDTLHSLLPRLGFEISQKKLVTPTTYLNCLGILVNTKEFTLC